MSTSTNVRAVTSELSERRSSFQSLSVAALPLDASCVDPDAAAAAADAHFSRAFGPTQENSFVRQIRSDMILSRSVWMPKFGLG